MAETLENYSFFDKGIFHILQDALHVRGAIRGQIRRLPQKSRLLLKNQ